MSASFILIGLASTSLNAYVPDKSKYAENGTQLTSLFDDLRIMYYEIKSIPISSDLIIFVEKLKLIQGQAIQIQSTKQVFLSDWYAHYKFFWQIQIEWIDEVRTFSLWRDKLPLSFSIILGVGVLYAIYLVLIKLPLRCI